MQLIFLHPTSTPFHLAKVMELVLMIHVFRAEILVVEVSYAHWLNKNKFAPVEFISLNKLTSGVYSLVYGSSLGIIIILNNTSSHTYHANYTHDTNQFLQSNYWLYPSRLDYLAKPLAVLNMKKDLTCQLLTPS